MIFGACCITHVDSDSFFCLPTCGSRFFGRICFLHFFTTFFGETPTLEFEEEAGRYSSRVDNKSI